MYHTSHRFVGKEEAIKLAEQLGRMLDLPVVPRGNGTPQGEHVGHGNQLDSNATNLYAVWVTTYNVRDMYTAYGFLRLNGAEPDNG